MQPENVHWQMLMCYVPASARTSAMSKCEEHASSQEDWNVLLDITLKGLAALRKCKEIYLEAYTSILTVPVDRLEKAYGVTITVADREFVESGIEPVLERAQSVDIALLVVGDPFGATTHCDLLARAKQVVHARACHGRVLFLCVCSIPLKQLSAATGHEGELFKACTWFVAVAAPTAMSRWRLLLGSQRAAIVSPALPAPLAAEAPKATPGSKKEDARWC
eukprot:4556752-Pleurochrysis_carterae.AAC.2